MLTYLSKDAAAQRADKRNKQVTFKNCAPFASCISKINNTLVDNAKYLDVIPIRISSSILLMYHLVEYSENYSKHQQVYGSITKIFLVIR